MNVKEYKLFTPSPYFKVTFGCSNRDFYQVKNDLHNIGEKLEFEPWDGHIEEKCDYEGDLEEIIIYTSSESIDYCKAVLKHYNINYEPSLEINIHLSIF